MLLFCYFFLTPTSFMLAAVLKLRHTIPSSEHESVLAGDDMVNVAVVVKDVRTKERVLDTQEFSMSSPQITIEVPAASCIKYCRCILGLFSDFYTFLHSGLFRGCQSFTTGCSCCRANTEIHIREVFGIDPRSLVICEAQFGDLNLQTSQTH